MSGWMLCTDLDEILRLVEQLPPEDWRLVWLDGGETLHSSALYCYASKINESAVGGPHLCRRRRNRRRTAIAPAHFSSRTGVPTIRIVQLCRHGRLSQRLCLCPIRW